MTPDEIRLLRGKLGMTQHEFAVYLGISNYVQISRWENGHNIPQADTEYRLRYLAETGKRLLPCPHCQGSGRVPE